MRACLRACVRACVRTYIHTYIHTCMRAYVRAYVRACVRACVSACVCSCVIVYVRTYNVRLHNVLMNVRTQSGNTHLCYFVLVYFGQQKPQECHVSLQTRQMQRQCTLIIRHHDVTPVLYQHSGHWQMVTLDSFVQRCNSKVVLCLQFSICYVLVSEMAAIQTLKTTWRSSRHITDVNQIHLH